MMSHTHTHTMRFDASIVPLTLPKDINCTKTEACRFLVQFCSSNDVPISELMKALRETTASLSPSGVHNSHHLSTLYPVTMTFTYRQHMILRRY